LQINASIHADHGQSSQLASQFVNAPLPSSHPDSRIVLRDLAGEPVPHLSAERFAAFLSKPGAQRAQDDVVAYSDALIAELKRADVIVLGLPMYNFGVPSQLKSYFDHIARAGETFRYTANGPVGLLNGKKAYVFAARGGLYAGTALDTQTSYVRDFLRFVGIEEIEFVYAEGLAISAESKASRTCQRRETYRETYRAAWPRKRPPTGVGASMRTLTQIIPSVPTSDGAGVKLRRSLGSQRGLQVDPFLMLDEFYSDDPKDYIAGFPAHPHRGFETVTYMLDGHMRHEDHLGNRGDLSPGDVQWMTAARGIIHSEMPQQSEGRMRGFQLWINLPSKEKMKPAHYRDIPAQQIPVLALSSGGSAKVIAGTLQLEAAVSAARSTLPDAPLSTDPLYLDLKLPAGGAYGAGERWSQRISIRLRGRGGSASRSTRRRCRIAPPACCRTATACSVAGGARGAQLLLLAARPLREPVVQYGPFVMNTRQEIEQAVEDYRSGRFAA
jgi:redox-sensitive bicupin YhaK (pirin superfamily)/FMN-dependent NADH-azoreductase